jgi:hypothetical protein
MSTGGNGIFKAEYKLALVALHDGGGRKLCQKNRLYRVDGPIDGIVTEFVQLLHSGLPVTRTAKRIDSDKVHCSELSETGNQH